MNKKFAALFLLPPLLTSACAWLSQFLKNSKHHRFCKKQSKPRISPGDPDLINHLVKDNNAFALLIILSMPMRTTSSFTPEPSLALSMTLAGAKSTTEQGMIDALNLSLLLNIFILLSMCCYYYRIPTTTIMIMKATVFS